MDREPRSADNSRTSKTEIFYRLVIISAIFVLVIASQFAYQAIVPYP